MNLIGLTIKQSSDGLKKKEFSAVELAKAYLDKIKKTDPPGGEPGKNINAFLSFTEDLALRQAEQADQKIASGKFNELTGVPCAIKDAIMVQGEKCTDASKILENYVAPYDATVIKKLKEQGSVILGKTNTDEFTMGSSTEYSAFGVTKNPCDKTRVAGGSSGGSAAAVAADLAVYALGSDTGGSIRQPSSFCGIVGLCPTYGSVSRYGLIAHASSLDQIGPMAKTAEDCKIVFDVIKGKDKLDATTVNSVDAEKFKNFKIKNARMGVPREYFSKGREPEVEKIIKNAIKKAEDAGAKIVEISLPSSEFALACYYIIDPCEISANLARFDGIKYGLSEQGDNLLDVYLKSRGRGLGQEVKRRIMIGTYCLSSGYYDAYYKKALEVRRFIHNDFAKAFNKMDFLFCPVSPFPSFKIGAMGDDPMAMYLADIYTLPMKLVGLPGLSLPAGKTKEENLPVGLQIIGNHFEEDKILAVAQEMENML